MRVKAREREGAVGDLKKMMQKKLGFGCMRLPVLGEDGNAIDDEQFGRMIDSYMEQGFCYFDTAYPYHGGNSERAVRRCLVERYDRDSFFLADKMPVWLVKQNADYEKLFQEQLERCGVSYFDFYLLHAMNEERVSKAEENGGFAFMQKMKAEGKVRHIGFSFHDTADVLDRILTDHPEMEFVQLQINYYDWDSEDVQAGRCYETAVRHGVPVIVMEPVKGGTLASMAGESERILRRLDERASYASYAIRFAASLDNVMLVLSGMSNEAQLMDNMAYMREFVPFNEAESAAIRQVVEELKKLPTIACTKCRYCVEGCPKKIAIPDLFDDYNMVVRFGMSDPTRSSYGWHTSENGKADECIRCGKCEGQCPQHLEIRELLKQVAETFA